MSISLDSLRSSLHSVEIQDASGQAIAIDGSGFLTTIINGSVVVTATQLDIDDLTHTTDSVKVGDGTDFLAIATDGSIAITDNGGSLTVDATQLDIDDLSSAADNVEIKTAAGQALTIDGSGFITANINGTVATTPAAFDIWKTSVVTATTTVGEIAATPLASRLRIEVQNLGSQDAYIGEDNTVLTTTGILLPKGSSYESSFGATANMWVITASGTADLRVAEFAD